MQARHTLVDCTGSFELIRALDIQSCCHPAVSWLHEAVEF